MNFTALFPTAKNLFNVCLLLLAAIIVSSCTTDSVGNGLRPSASVGTQTPPPPPPVQDGVELQATPATGETPANASALAPIDAPTQTAALDSSATSPSPGITFLPVLGPPQSAVSQLSSAVKRAAGDNAITIVPNGQRGATYQVKGYFSALDDGTGTRFIYIWDVLDSNGKNIHRISGEERSSSRGADPWSAINSNMINNVVQRTMQNLRGWIDTRA